MEPNLYYFFMLGVINGSTVAWACQVSSERLMEVIGRIIVGVIVSGWVVIGLSLAFVSLLWVFGAEEWWDTHVVVSGGPMDQWRVLVALTGGMAAGVFLTVLLLEKLAAIRQRRKSTVTREDD